MATVNRREGPLRGTKGARRRGVWLKALLALAVLAGALFWLNRGTIEGYATTGAAVGARNACSCRHLAGRSLDDCRKDFEPGMEVVFVREDEAARSVTGFVPLIASQTARYHEGFGCVLDPWEP